MCGMLCYWKTNTAYILVQSDKWRDVSDVLTRVRAIRQSLPAARSTGCTASGSPFAKIFSIAPSTKGTPTVKTTLHTKHTTNDYYA